MAQCRRKLKQVASQGEYLRKIGDDLCSTENKLFRLVASGTVEALDAFLKQQPHLEKEKVNEACHTALQEAVLKRDTEKVEILIDHGCDPAAGIELAAQIGTHEILDVLLAAVKEKEDGTTEAREQASDVIPEEMQGNEDEERSNLPAPTYYRLHDDQSVPEIVSDDTGPSNMFSFDVGVGDMPPLSWSQRVRTQSLNSEDSTPTPSPRFVMGPFNIPKRKVLPPKLSQRSPSHPQTPDPIKRSPDSPDSKPSHPAFDRSISWAGQASSKKQSVRRMPRPRISDDIKTIKTITAVPATLIKRKSIANPPSEALISAATADDYKGTELLIKVGYQIPEPHEPSCTCSICKQVKQVNHDLLHDAHDRIMKYRALTSAPYIILTSEDPILTALKRSDDLAELASLYPENKEEFEALSRRSSALAVELLRHCISEKEVVQLLMRECGLKGKSGIFKYGRLQLAVGLGQKEFVTNSTCQHSLYSLWLGPRKNWLKYSMTRKLIHVATHFILAPLICTAFVIVYVLPSTARKAHATTELPLNDDTPEKTFVERCRIDPISILTSVAAVPLNRFLYAASAYSLFLILLLYFIVKQGEHNDADAGLSWYHWLLCVWIISHVYKIVQDLYTERYLSYWTSWWTLYEMIMMVVFTLAAIFFIAGRIQVVDEKTWRLALVAEGLFAIGTTLSCMRCLQWMHLSQSLGPVIISFSRMTAAIGQLFIVFVIVLMSFSMGLYAVYQNFRLVHNTTSEEHEEDKGLFISYTRTLQALFWAIFGHGEAEYAGIPEGYVWHVTSSDDDESFLEDPNDSFPVAVGYTLWGLFHVAFVIVLLNMLIAVMTNQFQQIQDNFDMEWKFARTKLWMYYLEDHNAVPPPFNLLLPLTSLVALIVSKVKRLVTCRCPTLTCGELETVIDGGNFEMKHGSIKPFLRESVQEKTNEHSEESYKKTITTLIQRYVKNRKLKESMPAT